MLALLAGGTPLLASVGQSTPITISPAEDDQVRISWQAEMLRPYQLETSQNLMTWTDCGPTRIGAGSMLDVLMPRGPRGFYRLWFGAIRPGFDEVEMSRGDDHCYPQYAGAAAMVSLGFSINLFGTPRSACYVNNNGNITFDNPLFVYTPESLIRKQAVMIAPFWADVDSRNLLSNVTRFSDQPTLVDGHRAFGVTWRDVGYFNEHVDKTNSFQVLLIERADRNPGDFDIEFNYNQITWETGDASGGTLGFGGAAAPVGWANGSGLFMEYNGSGQSLALLDNLPDKTPNFQHGLIYQRWNNDVTGRLLIPVINGIPQTEADLDFLVNAGPDRTLSANAGRSFDLVGSISPPDTEGVTYSWELESGAADSLISNAGSLTASVLISEPGQYIFRLYGIKQGSFRASSSDTVTINHPATFEISGGSYYLAGDAPLAVVLDQAFAKFNGQPMTAVLWKQTDGSQALIQNPNSIKPTIILPGSGSYRFQLQASSNHPSPFVKTVEAIVTHGN
ncbi:MAG: hypothetical protein K9M97_10815 [Akkermansiaceae bacterium]|nr:hypothetical protein [Akkermansiaceae bacterium]